MRVFACAFMFFITVFTADAAISTITTLSIDPAGKAALLTVVTLTATVTDANANPVLYGTVTFFDRGLTVGKSQLVSHPSNSGTPAGRARWRTTVGYYTGPHQYSAQFDPLAGYESSRSSITSYLFVPRFAYPTHPSVSLEMPLRNPTTGKISFQADISFSNNLCCEFDAPPGENGAVTFRDLTAGVNVGTVPINPYYGLSLNPGFTPEISSVSVAAVGVADFDEDGSSDVVAPVVGQTSTLLGMSALPNPNPGWPDVPLTLSRLVTAAASSGNSIAVGDFNGDGHLDFIYKPDELTSEAVVYLGNGKGGFQPGVTLAGVPGQVITGDFNGDGRLDILIGWNTMYVYLGYGDGTFASPIVGSADGSPGQRFVADLNGDGTSDVISSAGVMFGKPNGTFGPPVSWLTDQSSLLAIGDVNGDGFADMAAASSDRAGIDIYLNDGHGNLVHSRSVPFSIPSGQTGIMIGDFNGDGNADILYSAYEATGVLLGHGDSSFDSQPATQSWGQSSPSCTLFGTGTYNDQAAEFVVGQPSVFPPGTPTLSVLVIGEEWRSFGAALAGTDVPGTGIHRIEAMYSGSRFIDSANSNVAITPTTLGDLTLSRSSYSFLTNPGLPEAGRVYLTNNSLQTVSFKPSVQGSSAFFVTKNCNSIIPGATCGFEVTYLPGQVQGDTGTLVLNPTGGPAGEAPTVALSGSGAAPAVLVSRTSHTFQTDVGAPTSGRIYITNNLPHTANLRPAITGDASLSLVYNLNTQQTFNCEAIPAFETCGINVVFSPAMAGTFSGTLNLNFVNAPAPEPPAIVSLIGIASMPPVLVSPTLLHFAVAVGATQAQSVVLTNNTATTVHLAPVLKLASNDHAGAYVLSETCLAIEPHQTCSVVITYSPVSAYSDETADLTLNFSDAPKKTANSVFMHGSGTTSRMFIDLWRASLRTNIGTYQPLLIKVTNAYPATVQLHPTLWGDPSFRITQNCASIPPGQDCNIEVTFSPTSVGGFSGGVSFNFVGSVSTPVTVTSLNGTGIE